MKNKSIETEILILTKRAKNPNSILGKENKPNHPKERKSIS